jgi:phage tail-like protein
VAEWRFKEAFPAKWLGPELNATQSQVAVETVELCHHGLVRQR